MPEYVDMSGRTRRTSDATTRALLRGMGFDAPTADAARAWLDELAREERETILEPVRVVERDSPGAKRVRVRLPPRVSTAEVELTLTEERGHVWQVRTKDASRAGTLLLPTRPPYGYHRLVARVRSGAREWAAEQSLIVVPASCVTPDQALGKGKKAMGIVANLYSVRREHDWGVGDLETLMQLVEWAGKRGAAFVGINPLHATFNRDGHVSPYGPISRLFRNPIYLDVERVPGFDASRRPDVSALHSAAYVDYDGVIDAKEKALRELHVAFRGHAASDSREYEDFVRLRDPELTWFATWMAIAEYAREPDWRRWPVAMRTPDSEAVVAFQRSHAERIDFHRWLQFEMHRQLGDIAHRARVLGMRIGVYQDLAIGSAGGGSDAWCSPALFVSDVSVGAPPDPYSATGQNWGFPPLNPRALRAQGYRYWIQLLRCAFENAGALRIDHILGLFRLFWIPAGMSGKDGAYVRYPAGDLLGILALESVRHDAMVVGEDLGTVPAEVPRALRKWGILSSKVLLFERDARTNGFKQARRYPALALATADTHDMAPLAGFWAERDIELREQAGLVPSPAALRQEKSRRRKDKAALLRLTRLRPPASHEEARFPRELTGAVHDFLDVTPSYLVGLSFDDLIGEVDPVNVPGVTQDTYPSWRRRTRRTMEEVSWSFEVDDTIRCENRRANG